MCTLSWGRIDGGYALWFNRDERHTRAAEVPPERHETNGVAWLAPEDPDSGGAWLMVNARGVTSVLLNDYTTAWSTPAAGTRASRGRLVPRTATAGSAADAVARAASEDLADTPPFDLIAVDAAGGASRLHWNGADAQVTSGAPVRPPFSSSSFRPAEVIAARTARFPETVTAAALRAFHFSHDPAAGAWSVNMSRDDAATRSIVGITVGADEVTLSYHPQTWPGAPAPRARGGEFRLVRAGGFKGGTGRFDRLKALSKSKGSARSASGGWRSLAGSEADGVEAVPPIEGSE